MRPAPPCPWRTRDTHAPLLCYPPRLLEPQPPLLFLSVCLSFFLSFFLLSFFLSFFFPLSSFLLSSSFHLALALYLCLISRPCALFCLPAPPPSAPLNSRPSRRLDSATSTHPSSACLHPFSRGPDRHYGHCCEMTPGVCAPLNPCPRRFFVASMGSGRGSSSSIRPCPICCSLAHFAARSVWACVVTRGLYVLCGPSLAQPASA